MVTYVATFALTAVDASTEIFQYDGIVGASNWGVATASFNIQAPFTAADLNATAKQETANLLKNLQN